MIEVFGGQNRNTSVPDYTNNAKAMPSPFQRALSWLLPPHAQQSTYYMTAGFISIGMPCIPPPQSFVKGGEMQVLYQDWKLQRCNNKKGGGEEMGKKTKLVRCRNCGRIFRAELRIGEREFLDGWHGECDGSYCWYTYYESLGGKIDDPFSGTKKNWRKS